MTLRRAGVVVFALAALLALTPYTVDAQSASDIQRQIEERNSQLKQLQAEIAQYQKELNSLGAKRTTLQSAVNELALNQKQLTSKIRATENQIATANLQIQRLSLSIGDKEATIAENQEAIAGALRAVRQNERVPLVATLISSRSFDEAWEAADQVAQFNRALTDNIDALHAARVELVSNRDEVEAEKTKLVKLQSQLRLEKRQIDQNKLAQQQLLNQTKNQEANYQALIAQKQASQKAFESELLNLQSQLNLIVNPSALPKVGSGVLSWPFGATFMNNCGSRRAVFGNAYCITQFFGNTPFSTANPQIYNGNGHNAIDIAAPIGTPVVAALGGTILGTGNTDASPGCYSFGKWIMVKHNNGLNTMYSHLSQIDVSKGQTVGAGQVIGLSGMTGYATGPHIHFGVYASEGTKIQTLNQFRGATGGCANALMPVATLKAYLNPMSYL